MRDTVHRHLGKVLTGAAIAAAATAAMVAVTLPGTAGADETGGAAGGTRAAGQAGPGQDAAPPGVVEEAPAEEKQGTGRDPLTGDEALRVEKIAAAGQLSVTGRDVEGDRGPQRLSVDLAEPEAAEADDPDAPRRADVTFYDYRNDTLVTKTVNLSTGKVERTGTSAASSRRRAARRTPRRPGS
ncbi:hypothetical protein GCM10017687_32100 [Streptomyces echinatus]